MWNPSSHPTNVVAHYMLRNGWIPTGPPLRKPTSARVALDRQHLVLDNGTRDPDLLVGLSRRAETYTTDFLRGADLSGIMVLPWDHPLNCQKLASSIPCCREGRTKHSLSVTPIQPFIMRASRLTHQVMLLQTFQLSPENLIFQDLTLSH